MPTISSQSLVLKLMIAAFILFSFELRSVYAQEKSANQAPVKSEQEQKVEIKAKQYDARREDTVTKIVVTEEEIKQYGESSIADILKRQSGITVVGNSIQMHGMGNGYTQVLIDGASLVGAGIDAINVNQIKRIEIIRSATADMSTQGIAGTINIVTKKMESKSRNFSIYADKFASSSFGGMSFEQSDKTENFSYGVSVNVGNGNFSSGRQRALSIQNGLDEAILNYKARLHSKSSSPTLSIEPRLTWVLDNADTVTMRNRIYYQKVSGQELTDWSVMSGYAPNANGNIVNEKMNDDRKGLNAELNWERKFADEFGGESTLQANFGFTYFNLNSVGFDYAKNSGVQLISSRNTRNNESQQDWNTRGSFNTIDFIRAKIMGFI